MAYFHSKWVRSRGGVKRRMMRRLTGETVEELMSVQRSYPDQVTINWPRRDKESYKSKSLPTLWIDEECGGILERLGSVEVPDEYLNLLTWMIRRQLYCDRVGMTPEIAHWFDLEIRGNLIKLLRSGSWVDRPESPSLENLNSRLEKIDLGRRSDLNFSSEQSLGRQKYDPDYSPNRKPQAADEAPDFETMYRDGDAETRREILDSRPWMKRMLEDQYGLA